MQKLLECKKFLGFGFIACVILIPLMIAERMNEGERYLLLLATYFVALLGVLIDKNKLFTIIGLFLWVVLMTLAPFFLSGLAYVMVSILFLLGYASIFLFAYTILYPVALIGLLSEKKRYRLLSQMYFCILGCMILIRFFL